MYGIIFMNPIYSLIYKYLYDLMPGCQYTLVSYFDYMPSNNIELIIIEHVTNE